MTTTNGASAGAPAAGGGRLRRRLEAGGFAVTAEIVPPRGADAEPFRRTAAALRGWVDAVNVPDNPSSFVRMASWAGSLAALAEGVEPVMQVTGRDRNRIALQSDLLGAAAVGIPNLLLMTGDDPRLGDHADAKPVFDLDSTGLLRAARAMRDEGRLLSGRALHPAPTWFIGAVEDPFSAPAAAPAARLAAKVAAGAEFVQTQFVFDVDAFARWMAEVRELGLQRRCHILAGVGPIRSLAALAYLRDRLAGVHVPDAVARRLGGVPAGRVAEEGLRLCAEIIQQVAKIDGVAGVHVIAPGGEDVIPDILDRAGIAPSAPPGDAALRAGGEGGSRAG